MDSRRRIEAIRHRYAHDRTLLDTLTAEERAIGMAVDIAAVEMLPDTKVMEVKIFDEIQPCERTDNWKGRNAR